MEMHDLMAGLRHQVTRYQSEINLLTNIRDEAQRRLDAMVATKVEGERLLAVFEAENSDRAGSEDPLSRLLSELGGARVDGASKALPPAPAPAPVPASTPDPTPIVSAREDLPPAESEAVEEKPAYQGKTTAARVYHLDPMVRDRWARLKPVVMNWVRDQGLSWDSALIHSAKSARVRMIICRVLISTARFFPKEAGAFIRASAMNAGQWNKQFPGVALEEEKRAAEDLAMAIAEAEGGPE